MMKTTMTLVMMMMMMMVVGVVVVVVEVVEVVVAVVVEVEVVVVVGVVVVVVVVVVVMALWLPASEVLGSAVEENTTALCHVTDHRRRCRRSRRCSRREDAGSARGRIGRLWRRCLERGC